MISWLKAFMRKMFSDAISADILKQLAAGTPPANVTLDVSAPHLKSMLALSFAKALSELPAEKVRHCWAPLQVAYDDMDALHTKVRAHRNDPALPKHGSSHAVGGSLQASGDLERLFPNKQAPVPDGDEPEPSSDAEDDFEDVAFEETPSQARRRVEAEHRVAADAAGGLGVPTQRPTRAAATAANQAMDALHERGDLV